MTKTSNFQKLHINYGESETLDPAIQEVGELKEFNAYYEVNSALMKRYLQSVHREELELLSVYYNPEKVDVDFDRLLAGMKEPENDIEQLMLNLSAILKSITEVKDDINLSYLKKLQISLHQKLQNDSVGIGLRMESNSLFSDTSTIEEQHPLDEDAKAWLDELLKMVNSKDVPALVRSWSFFYYFNALKPFSGYNELLSYIVCKKTLASEKLDFFNLLNPEKYVIRNKNVVAVTAQLNEIEDYDDRIHADLTGYIEACINGYRNNIKAIRLAITDTVREQLDYQSLTPRQKNSLNFWLEKAFFIHRDKLEGLSPRQHEMMLLIAKYGSLSNKDLVPVFMVDRKTIQRDFNSLLDLKLLDQRGGGRALKYYINLRVEI